MMYSSFNGACMIFLAFLLATHSSVAAFSVPVASFGVVTRHHNHQRRVFTIRQTCRISMVSSESTSTAEALSADFQKKQQLLQQALKKPGKTLAVALEYYHHPAGTDKNINSKNNKKSMTLGDLSTLSYQLRKAMVSALVTADLAAAAEFVSEQASAAGNFPGPCPVIYSGDRPDEAMAAGVTAVVLSVAEAHVAATEVSTTTASDKKIPIIWKVDSCDDVNWVITERVQESMAFWVDAGNENAASICEALPTGSVVIASTEAMMPDNAEIASSRALVKTTAGVVTCILLRQACVGDTEDMEYANFVVSRLAKKRSSSFDVSGLTSTSTTWLRKKRATAADGVKE
jgi:hypothetical protein